MTSNEFREFLIGKTEFEATSQNNVVFEALGYAKMITVGIVKEYQDTALGEAEVQLEDGKTFKDYENFDRDLPIYFDLDNLIFHIDKIQGYKKGTNQSKSATDRKDIDSILRKLRILRSNVQLKFIFENNELTLKHILLQFLMGSSIKIIDISGLPNEITGIMTSIIARLIFLFKLHQTREEREKSPILLVCEEAHRYVPNAGEAQYKEAQIAIKRIAKEGRKYGLGLLLVSQRPSELENTVLSQCNTWIILKITNSNDKSFIANYLPDNSLNLVSILSSMARREAIIVGNAVSIPCRIKINELSTEKLPESNDISFINGWLNHEIIDNTIDRAIKRWTFVEDTERIGKKTEIKETIVVAA
jgi:DNA helicase HerA-like ATPase